MLRSLGAGCCLVNGKLGIPLMLAIRKLCLFTGKDHGYVFVHLELHKVLCTCAAEGRAECLGTCVIQKQTVIKLFAGMKELVLDCSAR